MLLPFLLLNLGLCLTSVGADAKSLSNEGLEDLVEKLEFRLREVETRLESKEKEKDESKKREKRLEATISKLRKEVEEYSNDSNPSLRDLPIVLISAWHSGTLTSPQTVTFDSFLSNFNNQDRPGGGSGVLDLESGIFTCFTPGYYTVSFSAYGNVGGIHATVQYLYLYKNGSRLDESICIFYTYDSAPTDHVGVTGSRIVVSRASEPF